MVFARSALFLSVVLVAAACTTSGSSSTSVGPSGGANTLSISNQGGALEGHTPTGFAGSGPGLFVGDNLNPGFPEGQGVQTYLTFDLPKDLAVVNARIASKVLETLGSPFEDLGILLIEPVEYSSFGPEIFDMASIGSSVPCEKTGSTTVVCEVTSDVQVALDEGRDNVQFRLRFERPADNDGQPDLAFFYRSDSNTNEPGLFTLFLTLGE